MRSERTRLTDFMPSNVFNESLYLHLRSIPVKGKLIEMGLYVIGLA